MNPSAASPADVSMLTKERIEAVCSEFRARHGRRHALRRNGRPSSAYVAGDRCPERSSLLAELIMLDLELRRRDGDTPDRKEYRCTLSGRFRGGRAGVRVAGESRIPWPRKGWLKPCNACRRVIGP